MDIPAKTPRTRVAPELIPVTDGGHGPSVPKLNPWLAVLYLLSSFGLPVYLSYQLSGFAQPYLDTLILDPLKTALSQSLPFIQLLLVGDYGLLTLGAYSFIWAFPVVVMMAIALAFTEQSGLKLRISASLDSALRWIGLNGNDLIPVMTGFGCNVVAVFQSRSCNSCTRKACVSMISLGSACSYQIGATLSVFNSSGHPGLFGPYITLLFFVGAMHTRLWHGPTPRMTVGEQCSIPPLRRPSLKAMGAQLNSSVRQFLQQAMPIFLLICLVATLLKWFGIVDGVAHLIAPLMNYFGLPGHTGPAIVFSFLRKDGLMVLNQDGGELLRYMTAKQVLIAAWIASTLSACLVTLWTISKELGGRFALVQIARQILSSVAVALLLHILL